MNDRPARGDDPESSDAAPVERGAEAHLAAARALVDAGLGRPRGRALLGNRRRQGAAAVVVLAAVGMLAFQGLTSATEYFLTAKQAVLQRASLGSKPFRIEGTVEPGVRQRGQTVRFSIFADGVTVAVVSTGSPPQLFRVGIPVVLDGRWQGGHFASDLIMVKHSASYTAAHPNRLKSQLPTPPG